METLKKYINLEWVKWMTGFGVLLIVLYGFEKGLFWLITVGCFQVIIYNSFFLYGELVDKIFYKLPFQRTEAWVRFIAIILLILFLLVYLKQYKFYLISALIGFFFLLVLIDLARIMIEKFSKK